MPLSLTRRVGETITVGKGETATDITITEVNGTDRGEVRLSFDAPHTVPVWRQEVAGEREFIAEVRAAVHKAVLDRKFGELTAATISNDVAHLLRYPEATKGPGS